MHAVDLPVTSVEQYGAPKGVLTSFAGSLSLRCRTRAWLNVTQGEIAHNAVTLTSSGLLEEDSYDAAISLLASPRDAG